MPQIAQQDYKVIAPKPGRDFKNDAAALGELKKAILNGIGFDCIIKDTVGNEGDFNRVLGLYPDGSNADVWSGNSEILSISMSYTVTQYQGLAAVQEAEDELLGEITSEIPVLITLGGSGFHLGEDNENCYICVEGKFIIVSFTDDDKIGSLVLAETGPGEGDNFINITWEDAQKLIGLPTV